MTYVCGNADKNRFFLFFFSVHLVPFFIYYFLFLFSFFSILLCWHIIYDSCFYLEKEKKEDEKKHFVLFFCFVLFYLFPLYFFFFFFFICFDSFLLIGFLSLLQFFICIIYCYYFNLLILFYNSNYMPSGLHKHEIYIYISYMNGFNLF